jgi:hypothetical protein
MSDDKRRQILPIYKELQGYLLACQANTYGPFQDDNHYSKQFHNCLTQLSQITGEDYTRFQIKIHQGGYSAPNRIDLREYKLMLNA